MRQNRRTFLRHTAFAGGAFTLRGFAGSRQLIAAQAGAGSNEQLESIDSHHVRQQFQSPPKKYRPLVRWWWPGNDVTDSELRREVEALDKAGLGGAEIQAFFKGFAVKELSEAQIQRMDGFASESFFRHVGVAVEEAWQRGMFIDYTFGSGWPFGGGSAITPELASIELRSTHQSVEGPGPFHERLQIPSLDDGDPANAAARLTGLPDGWAERMKKRSRVVAVVAARGQDAQWAFHHPGASRQTLVTPGRLERDTAVDLTAHLQPDGTLNWEVPAGTWQLFVFCSVPTTQRVNGAAGEGPQLVMDHLSSEAFAAHAKRVGDSAAPYLGPYFGNGLRAIFCDSLEVGANLFWSDDFLIEFRRRRGYDLLPYLPVIQVQTHDEPYGEYADIPVFDITEIGGQVRSDYRQTISDLMNERFYQQFNKWAHDHKLLSRTQAHGAPVDVLRVYGEADIPETEDLYDQGGYDFLKMAASAAHVYGRAIVGSESFVWPGALYQTTPEKMKIAADELLTAGVNAIVYHGFPYVVPSLPAPGWHPFNGKGDGNYASQLNELNPFWPFLAQLNGYITRLQYISQIGANVAAVGLYRNDLAHGADEMLPAPKLNQALLDAGYNYDHINADSLLHSEVRNRTLVTAGGAAYRALVFPPLDSIDARLTMKLQNFAQAGLPIFFAGRVPSHSNSLSEGARATERVRVTMRSIGSFPNVQLANDVAGVVTKLKQAAEPNIRFHTSALSFIQKRIGGMNVFFLRNASDAAQRMQAEFEAQGAPELWDPWTGRAEAIAGYRRNGDWVEIKLDLQPFSSVLIVFGADSAATLDPPVARSRSVGRRMEIGTGGWKLTATRFASADPGVVFRRDLTQLIDWSLDSELRGFSGQGVYTTTFTMPSADSGAHFILDLGDVKDVAEVKVNGKSAATLLLRPFRTDISAFVQPGENILEITVTNALFNCMVLREPRPFPIGATGNPSGLMSSGLIGPVQLTVTQCATSPVNGCT